MATPQNPLSAPQAWDLVASDYTQITAPFFENYAEAALAMAEVGPKSKVLDVACGPGTLALVAARRGCAVAAIDFSPRMIDKLSQKAKRENLSVEAVVGDGMALPFGTGRFTAGFSMFGLVLFPDRMKGLSELHRVVEPGGTVAIGTWPPLEQFPMLHHVMTTLKQLMPDAPLGPTKGPMSEASEIAEEMVLAGFDSVVVREVSATITAETIESAWDAIHRGSVPFALLRKKAGDDAWQKVEQAVLASLREKYGSGPQSLTMVAYIGIGQRPQD